VVKNDDSKGRRKYQHLSPIERGQIEALRGEGHGVTSIAARIGRDKSTVSRELRRGMATQRQRTKYLSKDPNYPEFVDVRRYFADTGQAVYMRHRKNSRNPFKIGEAAEFVEYADALMKEKKWSPDVVCGRAGMEQRFLCKPRVCAKTLYNYIDAGLMKTKNIDLCLKVVRKPKKQRVRQNRRILGESIETRPEEVQGREEFGHWEIDSVIGKTRDREAVMTLVERKSRYQYAVKLAGKGSSAVDAKVTEIYSRFGEKSKDVFKSVTGDNGSEFAGLSEVLRGKSNVYFCHPYSSWEKGTNENHNGLLRRMVKKGKSIDAMPASLILRAAAANNNLPRKILGYKTPAECFAKELARLMA
jgi:IS30 family transposase